MHPSANSLIVRKPGFVFALVNGSGIFFALIMYLSGTAVLFMAWREFKKRTPEEPSSE
jgi:hypothetical protein